MPLHSEVLIGADSGVLLGLVLVSKSFRLDGVVLVLWLSSHERVHIDFVFFVDPAYSGVGDLIFVAGDAFGVGVEN